MDVNEPIDLPGDVSAPTCDHVPDGTQLPVGGEDEPNQDQDAGIGDCPLPLDWPGEDD